MKELKLLLISALLILTLDASASHIMGADISYSHESAYRYKITAKLYRDCSGIPLNDPDFRLRSSDNSYNLSLSYVRTAINDLSLHCKDSSGPCTPVNAPGKFGVEEHVYETIVDFAKAPYSSFLSKGFCEVKISVEQCCRNGAITTLSPGNFYSDAMLNICESLKNKDNSPVFTTPPVYYLCVNNTATYSPSVLEVDPDDSLSFELVAPMNANNVNENYNSPFGPANPLSTTSGPGGFYFDNKTGYMVITPTNASQVGVIVIKVSEWRKDSTGKMRVIGYVRREMEVFIKNCSNSNSDPYFSGNGNYSICEGDRLCFNVMAKDDPFLPKQTAADTIEVSVINQEPGIKVSLVDSNSREKEIQVCWQTWFGHSRVMPYQMTLIAKDNYCPDPRIAYKPISIKVKSRAFFNVAYLWKFRAQLRFRIVPDNSSGTYNYNGVIKDTSGSVIYSTSKFLDSFQFTKEGTYYVEHTLNEPGVNCPYVLIDTFQVSQTMITDVKGIDISAFTISPNPGSGLFKIITNSTSNIKRILVYSVDGKLIKEVSGDCAILDLSSCAEGAYTVEIQTDAGNYKRIVLIGR